jgi:hypothetical protein
LLLARKGKGVVVVRGSTFDNAAKLAPPFLQAINGDTRAHGSVAKSFTPNC